MTVTEFAFFLATIEYSQLKPVTTRTGSVLLPEGFSRPKQILSTWVYYFFQTMGRGLFPLLTYWGMVGLTWRPLDTAAPLTARVSPPGRNTPCPCGSGRKYKRCCGAG